MNVALVRWLMAPEVPEESLTLEDFLARPAWHLNAACRCQGTRTWFSGAEETVDRARAVCRGCPVRQECYDAAMADRDLEGVWGGITAKERRELRRAVA